MILFLCISFKKYTGLSLYHDNRKVRVLTKLMFSLTEDNVTEMEFCYSELSLC